MNNSLIVNEFVLHNYIFSDRQNEGFGISEFRGRKVGVWANESLSFMAGNSESRKGTKIGQLRPP